MPVVTTLPLLQVQDPAVTRWIQIASAAFRPVAEALANTPIMGAPQNPWIRATLATGFAQTNGAAVVAYQVDDMGCFHSKGRATHAAGCAAGTALLTLPQGYRPLEAQAFPVRGNGASYQSLAVSAVGVVTVEVAIAAGGTVDFAISFLVGV